MVWWLRRVSHLPSTRTRGANPNHQLRLTVPEEGSIGWFEAGSAFSSGLRSNPRISKSQRTAQPFSRGSVGWVQTHPKASGYCGLKTHVAPVGGLSRLVSSIPIAKWIWLPTSKQLSVGHQSAKQTNTTQLDKDPIKPQNRRHRKKLQMKRNKTVNQNNSEALKEHPNRFRR